VTTFLVFFAGFHLGFQYFRHGKVFGLFFVFFGFLSCRKRYQVKLDEIN